MRPVTLVVRLGVRLLDEYLEFLAGRCRPNTVLAVAYDLKVFFAAVCEVAAAGPPGRCAGVHDRSARRRGGPAAGRRAGRRRGVGADAATAAVERVGTVWVLARPRGREREPGAAGPADQAGTPAARPGRAAGAGAPDTAADPGAGRGRCADRRVAHAPGPGDGRGDGAGRPAPLRSPRAAAGGSAVRGAAGVHRRGQGRAPAADPGLAAVLHRGQRLPRCRAPARDRHGPGVHGAQGPAPRHAAVG